MGCINKNLLEFKKLEKESGLVTGDVLIGIFNWQKEDPKNREGLFPSLDELIKARYFKSISYTPTGKNRQIYTIDTRKSIIKNKSGKEVFSKDSKDRRRIFANLAVQDGRAIVIDHKDNKYIVNNKGAIMSMSSSDMMFEDKKNELGIEIRNKAKLSFNNRKNILNKKTLVETAKEKIEEVPILKLDDLKNDIENATWFSDNPNDPENLPKNYFGDLELTPNLVLLDRYTTFKIFYEDYKNKKYEHPFDAAKQSYEYAIQRQEEFENNNTSKVINTERELFFNSGILTTSDIVNFSNKLPNFFSQIVDRLMGYDSNPEWSAEKSKEYYFDEFMDNLKDIDFTKMKREEVIKYITPFNLLEIVRRQYFDMDLYDEDSEIITSRTKEQLEKLRFANNNFGYLVELASAKLLSTENVIVKGVLDYNKLSPSQINTLKSNQPSELQDAVEVESKYTEAWAISQRNIDGAQTLSTRMKSLISGLYSINNTGKDKLDEYGFEETMDPIVVYAELTDILSNTVDIYDMINVLKTFSESKPWIKVILDRLEKGNFKSEFFNNFHKGTNPYGVVTMSENKDGTITHKNKLINISSAADEIRKNFLNTLNSVDGQLIKINPDGDFSKKEGLEKAIEISKNLLNMLNKHNLKYSNKIDNNNHSRIYKFSETITDVEVSMFKELLDLTGLKVDEFMLENGIRVLPHNKIVKITQTPIYIATNRIKEILNNIDNIANSKYPHMESLLAYTGNGISGHVKKVSTILRRFSTNKVQAGTRESGKSYYSYTTPSYIQETLARIHKDPKKYIEDEVNKYQFFIKERDVSGNNNHRYYHNIFYTIKNDNEEKPALEYTIMLSNNGIKYSDLDDLGYMTALLNYFRTGGKDKAFYHIPMLSNKPSGEFIKMDKYSNAKIKEFMIDIALQELKRMRALLEGVKRGPEYTRIDNYDPTLRIDNKSVIGKLNGAQFKFLTFLNKYNPIPVIKDDTIYYKNNNSIIEKYLNGENINAKELNELKEELYNSISSGLKNRYSIFKQKMNDIGLYNKTDTKKYKYLNQFGKNESDIDEFMENYFLNSMYATIGIIQLTTSDLAFYKNPVDFQKRFSQIHSSGVKLNEFAVDNHGELYSKDGLFKTITIKDEFIQSNAKSSILEVFNKKLETITDPIQKKSYSKFIENLSKKLDNINVTDGQAYYSINGARKILGAQDKWTDEMEDMYKEIVKSVKNNQPLSSKINLDIVFQPLKPFIYSQIEKDYGTETFDKIKKPINQKDSMFFLGMNSILGELINPSTRLGQLNRYMILNDIDAIPFNSSLKVGSQGVIDITNTSNVKIEDIEKHLKSFTYNNLNEYNDQYVDSIPIRDFMIQQEQNDHLLDSNVVEGVQFKRIITSDLPKDFSIEIDGNILTKKDVLDEWDNLHAAGIKNEYDKLVKEYSLDKPNCLNKRIKISELLKSEIRTSDRFTSDDLRAVSLDENGNFVVPLVDPLHGNRIISLLSSLVVKRLLKQKLPGGTAVQVSNWGTSDKLNVVFNEDGSVKYYECYIQMYDSRFENLPKNDDGSYYIPSSLLEAIGFRIPTEDKYSMLPLKVMGFLPKNSGSSIMLPREITLITGSDFDIDKLFLLLRAFEIKSSFNIDKFVKLFLEENNNYIKENKLRKIINNHINGNILDSIESKKIIEFYNKNYSKFIDTNFSTFKDDKSSNGYRINRIFDIAQKILQHPSTASKMLNPGNFDEQKRVSKIIKIMNNFHLLPIDAQNRVTYAKLSVLSIEQLDEIINDYDLSSDIQTIDPYSQIYFHNQNMSGLLMTGIFASNNSAHALLQNYNIGLDSKWFSKNLYGVKLGNEEFTESIDGVFAKDGITYISKNMASLGSAAVDAAKDPCLTDIGFNNFTSNVGNFLVRSGFSMETLSLFLNQPIIKEISMEYKLLSNDTYVDPKELTVKWINKLIIDTKRESNNVNIMLADFSKEKLFKNIINKKTKNPNIDLDILMLFNILSNAATPLSMLSSLVRPDSATNYPSGNIGNILNIGEKIDNYKNLFLNKDIVLNKNALNVLQESKLVNYSTEYSSLAIYKMFKDYFPYQNKDYIQILKFINENMTKALSSRDINSLLNEFTLFKLTKSFSDNSNRSVIDGNSRHRADLIQKLPIRIKEIQKNKLVNNELLNILSVVKADKKTPYSRLTIKNYSRSSENILTLKASWSDLFKSVNPELKSIAKDLVEYTYWVSGLQHGPISILNLIPIEATKNILGLKDALTNNNNSNSIFTESTDQEAYEFVVQFLRNHSYNKKYVPVFTLNKDILLQRPSSKRSEVVEANFIGTFNSKAPLVFRVNYYNDTRTSSQRLFEATNEENVYKISNPLGINNYLVEYSYNNLQTTNSLLKQLSITPTNEESSNNIKDNNHINTNDNVENTSNELEDNSYPEYNDPSQIASAYQEEDNNLTKEYDISQIAIDIVAQSGDNIIDYYKESRVSIDGKKSWDKAMNLILGEIESNIELNEESKKELIKQIEEETKKLCK